METFGTMLEKITDFLSITHDLFVLCPRFPFGSSEQSNLVVMIHDAFQPLSYWNGFMPSPNWQGVVLDTHIYQMFSVAVRLKTSFFLPLGLYFRKYAVGQPNDQCRTHLDGLQH